MKCNMFMQFQSYLRLNLCVELSQPCMYTVLSSYIALTNNYIIVSLLTFNGQLPLFKYKAKLFPLNFTKELSPINNYTVQCTYLFELAYISVHVENVLKW